MESIISYIFLLLSAVFWFLFISFIGTVLYIWISFFYEFFSSPKCPNCAKTTRTKATRCPRCGSSLKEEPPQDESEGMNTELYARVKVFVAEWTTISAEKLNPDTQLSNDLGIDGDDGVELITVFCEEFEIQNMSEIDLTEHFAPEGWDLFGIFLFSFGIYVFLYYLVFGREKLREEPTGEMPITLRDLVKSAEAKRWIPPKV